MDWVGAMLLGVGIFGVALLVGVFIWTERTGKDDDSEVIAALERRLAEHQNVLVDLLEKTTALENDIDSMEDRIFKLEDKFTPVELTIGDVADLAVAYPWSDPQYVWPNIGYAEISSTLDRQSGCSAE